MKITGGPNAQGWAVIFMVIFLCFAQQSILPLVIFICVMAVLTPLCIWLHFANERANARMLEEFPHDPFIQKKYAKYRKQ